MPDDEQEQKLLEILSLPEVEEAAGETAAEEAVESAFPDMDEKARSIMARVMKAQMPTPEEIEQAEKIAQHNAKVQEKRDAKQRAKELRRLSGGNRKRRKR
jgi:ABC-type uncharacterized transport system ATPase subunit